MEWKGGRKPLRGRVHHPKDVIALGAKSTDSKPSTSRPSIHDRKREAGSSLPPFDAKRKLLGPSTLTPLGRGFEKSASPSASTTTHGDSIAIEVPPKELVDKVLEADSNEEDDHVDALMCGAVKNLRQNRAKPDSTLYLAMMYLAKAKPHLFLSKVVMEAICSLLKRDIGLSFKSKGNPLVSVLACNLLMTAFADEDNWPEDFVKVYIEDSLGERVWVDQPKCKEFITNVLTAFGTRLPPKIIDPTARTSTNSPDITTSSASPLHDEGDGTSETGEGCSADVAEGFGTDESTNIISPRYSLIANNIDKFIVDLLKEQLARRQAMEIPRNLLRLLTVTAGLAEVRLLVVQRLEMWLQNPKITRLAQEVLMAICMNCSSKNQTDHDLIGHLIKIRMKTKQLVNHYMACIKELVKVDADNLQIVIKHIIYNELSNARNPNNMTMLSTLFSHSAELSATCLANVFQELLMNRDDYLRAIRVLFREIGRSMRYEIDLAAFCRGLMKERLDSTFAELDQQIKDRMLHSTTDLIVLSIMLTVMSPTIKEIKSVTDEKKDVLRNAKKVVSTIQRDAVWWFHTVVPKMYSNIQTTFLTCLRKVMLMDSIESYCGLDNWPQGADKAAISNHLYVGVPVLEDTLIRFLLIGLNRQLPVPPQEAFEIIDLIVKRAAVSMIKDYDYNSVHVEKQQMVDFVLDLCAYHHPENIALPQGYQPPSLAISKLYWKGWLLLVMLSAFNPSTIGSFVWENYPMLKCFMEMIMTNNYTYPPPTNTSDERTVDDALGRELQMCSMEKQEILEFEGHLAAASTRTQITEANSLFLSQLMFMNTRGPARKPPDSVLDTLRQLNSKVQLGIRLCRSRNPDFLLEVIQRQGTSQSKPWLADLVNSSESSLDVLPIQSLCEFLLHDSADATDDQVFDVETKDEPKTQKINKHDQLLKRLQFLIRDAHSEAQTTSEVLDYFLRRLSSQQTSARVQAAKALSDVLTNEDDYEAEKAEPYCNQLLQTHEWLLLEMPSILHFDSMKEQACHALTQACQVETDPQAISAYLVFLSHRAPMHQLHSMASLALDLAQLIVERPTIMHCVLHKDKDTNEVADQSLAAVIEIFTRYLRKAMHQKEEAYSWSDTQDQVFVRWSSGQAATVNILVVHAMVILLTYGKPKGQSLFEVLLDAWFPDGEPLPSAFLVDTSEEALLLPDWLKLRMIRSTVPRLVDAALQDLEPSQLILFIQSFGIPVDSMGKLMNHLDIAVHNDPSAMEQAVVDKAYMAQLVEVQHRRGASGGHEFLKMLGSNQSENKDDVEMESVEPKTIVQKMTLRDAQRRSRDEWENILKQVFNADDKNKQALSVLREIQCISYKGIQKLKDDHACMTSLLEALHQLVTSDQEFLSHFTQRHSISSCFINILTTYQISHKSSSNSYLLVELLNKMAPEQTPLANVVQQAKKKLTKLTSIGNDNTGFGKLQLDKLLENCFGKSDEPYLTHIRSKQIVDILSGNMQLKIDNSSTDKSRDVLLESTAGLLVDWFELLQPEIVDAVPELQQLLLFSKTLVGEHSERKQPSGSPYLLAVLTHQASWENLNHCIAWLLSLEGDKLKKIHASAALDFIWACLHIPKIWQGRTLKAQKSLSEENALCLSAKEVCTIAHYIITEAEVLLTSTESNQQPPTNSVKFTSEDGCPSEIIQARLPLLLNCCYGSRSVMDEVVSYLSIKMQQNNRQCSLYQTLLLELYIQAPADSDVVNVANLGDVLSSNNYAKVDIVTHRLLLSLVDIHQQEKWKSKVSKANSVCRKLAAVHPILMLRQLGMISVLCQGRTNVSFPEFRNRGLITFFMNILGLMELLQPQVFKQDSKAFHSILDAYFGVIKRYGVHKKPFEVMYSRFVVLLYEYNAHCPTAAQKILENYATILNELSFVLPDLHQLKCILAGITLTHTSKDHTDNTENSFKAETAEEVYGIPSRDSTASPALLVSKDQIWGPSLIASFTNRLGKHQDSEDVTDTLHDLDEQCSKMPQVLDNFSADLMRLMSATSVECRIMAFSLIIKLLRQNPSTSIKFLPAFLQCLDSSDNEVIETALKHLPEFCLLCQESARILLEKAFRVGVDKRLDATSIISDTMQLLNMEMMSTS